MKVQDAGASVVGSIADGPSVADGSTADGTTGARCFRAFRSRLNRSLGISILCLLVDGVNRVINLVTDGVISLRGRWDGVVYDDPRQVQVLVDGPNLF